MKRKCCRSCSGTAARFAHKIFKSCSLLLPAAAPTALPFCFLPGFPSSLSQTKWLKNCLVPLSKRFTRWGQAGEAFDFIPRHISLMRQVCSACERLSSRGKFIMVNSFWCKRWLSDVSRTRSVVQFWEGGRDLFSLEVLGDWFSLHYTHLPTSSGRIKWRAFHASFWPPKVKRIQFTTYLFVMSWGAVSPFPLFNAKLS